MELTGDNVRAVLEDSLFNESEMAEIAEMHLTPEQVLEMESPPFLAAEGILHSYAFHTERLRSHADDVASMLMQLPEEFRQSKGGGWSFLQAYMRQDGVHWGEHESIERLLCMGIALGYARWLLPKEMWKVLPGEMPYVVVLDKVMTPDG